MLLSLGVLVACGKSDAAREQGPPAPDGETIYMRSCAACHMADGTGQEGVYPPLARADYLSRFSVEMQIDSVVNGMRGPLTVNGRAYNAPMPALGRDLSNAQIAAVLTYVRASWGNALPPITTEQVAKYRGY